MCDTVEREKIGKRKEEKKVKARKRKEQKMTDALWLWGQL